MIFGKLSAQGVLTDVRQGPQTTWPDGSQDVPLVAMPSTPGPWGYDPATQTATPLLATAKAAKLASLEAWKTGKFAPGVVVTDNSVSPAVSYTWAATEPDGTGQDLIHKQWSATQAALKAGALTEASTVQVYDVSKSPPAAVSLPVSTFEALVLQYDQAVQTVYLDQLSLTGQIIAAQTEAALDGITFPS